MVRTEINELLTQIGPGTPCGELMRRYWQPVALAEELPAGSAPLSVRLLGEDLVLFRDPEGRPGLLSLYCAHRCADLSYGRIEDGGLRCIYHGWLYDIHGRCLEQPNEPPDRAFHEKIRLTAYPCVEAASAIFAYLGPGEPPLLPAFEFLMAPPGHVATHKIFSECNYLQGNEGNIDSTHGSFIHRVMSDAGLGRSEHRWFDTIETQETEYGIKNYWVRQLPDRTIVHTTVFVMPDLTRIGNGTETSYNINWHVPIDDTRHWKYYFQWKGDQVVDNETVRAGRTPITPDYHPIPNKANRYLQDRSLMKDVVYSGIPNQYFQAQDLCVIEPRPILDRTQEHPGYADTAIMAARGMILRAIKDVQEGLDPPGVVRDAKKNHFALVLPGGAIPASEDWRTHYRH